MKKSIFFLAAGAMAFTACTSEEVIEESMLQTNAIGFQSVVGKEAREILTDDFSNFFVYGYYTKEGEVAGTTAVVGVFNDKLVSKKDGAWSYSDTRYWVPDASYFFYAYSCDNQNTAQGVASFNQTGQTKEARRLTLENFRSDNTHKHDLVFAANEGMGSNGILGKESSTSGTPANAAVSFKFSHILSRVRITFKSGFAAGYQLKISNVRIENIRNVGDFTPEIGNDGMLLVKENGSLGGKWTGNDEGLPERKVANADEVPFLDFDIAKVGDITRDIATAAVPAQGENAAVAAVDALTVPGYVIPCAYKEANVKLVFDVLVMDAAGTQVYAQTIAGTWTPEWKLGTAYNYNITITGTAAGLEPINFVADQVINGWPDSTSVIPGEDDGNDTTININMNFESSTITQ